MALAPYEIRIAQINTLEDQIEKLLTKCLKAKSDATKQTLRAQMADLRSQIRTLKAC